MNGDVNIKAILNGNSTCMSFFVLDFNSCKVLSRRFTANGIIALDNETISITVIGSSRDPYLKTGKSEALKY
jgi:spore coat protein U-like protein